MSTNIGVKFNNGNTALVWTGSGMATLESLGLATRAWVERLQKQADETTAELAAESELVAALQSELSRVTEAAARQVAEAREEQREACALVALDPTNWDADDVSTGYPEDVARDIRATPLGATPLADELVVANNGWAAAMKLLRSAEADEARVKELEAKVDSLRESEAWRETVEARNQLDAARAELLKYQTHLTKAEVKLEAGRDELAATQAREERLRNLLDGVAAAFEEVIAEADRPKGGMHVPFHGEFSAALRLPSVVARMRWWVREFRAALAEKPEATPKEPKRWATCGHLVAGDTSRGCLVCITIEEAT